MKITHEEAVKIDTKLAELWGQSNALMTKIDMYKNSLASTVGLKGEWGRGVDKRKLVYPQPLSEIIELAEVKLAGEVTSWDRRSIEEKLDKISELQDEYKAVRELAQPLEAQYAANPWSRFFLVQNANGHIHSSMQCHSCGPRTMFGWLPNLSGLTEKDAVDAHGTVLCSHCYPSAPVEWTLGIQKEEDLDLCPGSGTYDMQEGTLRTTSWKGSGRAVCTHCNKTQPVTSTHKFRKHKKVAA